MTGPISTNPDFIYQTPLVQFVSRVTPFVVNQSLIDIAAIRPDENAAQVKQSLVYYLTNMFDGLLEMQTLNRTFTIRLACSYGYYLTGQTTMESLNSDEPLVALTPILLKPHYDFNAQSEQDFIEALSEAISAWTQSNNPSRSGGYYVFDITVFSQTAAQGGIGATGVIQQPILRLENLQLSIAGITGLNEPTDSE